MEMIVALGVVGFILIVVLAVIVGIAQYDLHHGVKDNSAMLKKDDKK